MFRVIILFFTAVFFLASCSRNKPSSLESTSSESSEHTSLSDEYVDSGTTAQTTPPHSLNTTPATSETTSPTVEYTTTLDPNDLTSQTEMQSLATSTITDEVTSSVTVTAPSDEPDEPEYTLFADFSKEQTYTFHPADGWSNGSVFNCTWRKNNIEFDGTMKLKIDTDGTGYSGAEYRTNENYGFGMYEVEMKPIKNIGVVSSFFTYTGPSENNPWDEIDIEFLGYDTTIVQFNYYTNGVGGKEYIYELGFDASEDFHTYGFDWTKNSITWYVDGKAVHTATEQIPTTQGKIMMNVWNGIGVDGWLGAYDGKTPLTAEYKYASFIAYD